MAVPKMIIKIGEYLRV